MSMKEGLKLYGHGMQGAYGDVKGDRPSMWNIVERSKWDSWDAQRGVKSDDAQKQFLNVAVSILKRKGYSDDDPN